MIAKSPASESSEPVKSKSTAVDFDLTDGVDGDGNDLPNQAAGDFGITVNLGLGF